MPAREEIAAEMTGRTRPDKLDRSREQSWSWARGKSRASNRGSRSPGKDTMSSFSSGVGSFGGQFVSTESPVHNMYGAAAEK